MSERAGSRLLPILSKVEVFPATCRTPILRVAATSFQTDPHCLERLRGWVHDRLSGAGYASLLPGILLAVNELAANTLRHTASGNQGGSFTIAMTWDTTTVRVIVGDQGCGPEPKRRHADDDDEDGRGLGIVEALADRWGWQATAFGIEVWAEFSGKPDDTEPALSGQGDDPGAPSSR
jgi:anti-sigma regulatory factor (Ser/Thr protein kinase)